VTKLPGRKKLTHRVLAKKFNISDVRREFPATQLQYPISKYNFKNGSTFALGTQVVLFRVRTSLAVMANSIMCKEATQKRNLRVIFNRRVHEAILECAPGCYSSGTYNLGNHGQQLCSGVETKLHMQSSTPCKIALDYVGQ
jgi:hypothetical protein